MEVPTWSPDWSDVQFDHHAARSYAEACRRTGNELTRIRTQRDGLARSAIIGWEGSARERFDAEIAGWDRQAEALSSQLIATASHVEAASAEARQAQARREELRQRWTAEQRAEQQAAELAAQQARERAADIDHETSP
jgi:uncharacterized protein YukE